MNKVLTLFLTSAFCIQSLHSQKIICRQGQISFFSYTSVENIEAQNNQVFSAIDTENSKIEISMLMNAFMFEKALMYEHFNKNYIESDIYPKATFTGKILDFEPKVEGTQVKMVQGAFTMHGVTEQLVIKAKIKKSGNDITLTGSFETLVETYNIKIPPLLAGNIAKTIAVDFKLEYQLQNEMEISHTLKTTK
ncbi:YceI family protein [Allomuricauda sp. d1]|uniref:YceI family protein n=1 Tax=Allomuricauda sp. d1 TaxID=3136725 RepID=UPI0031DB0781